MNINEKNVYEIKKLEHIKKKYNNLNMTDEVAYKIKNLEKVNKALVAATTVCGIITFFDFIIPDPVLFVDEATLTGVTSLLGAASGIVKNNINKLVNGENAEFKIEDVQKLTKQINNIKSKNKEKVLSRK